MTFKEASCYQLFQKRSERGSIRKIRANSDMGHSSAELIARENVERAEVGLNTQGQVPNWHKLVRL